jgi:predicted NBD/HSP70 family sugar kinase
MRGLAGEKTLLKRLNRAAILRLVWEQPGVSRSGVAQTIGITKSTVSQLVAELHDEGWLSSDLPDVGSTPGRPSIPLHLNAGALALIGVELGVEGINAVAVDPRGQVLARAHAAGQHATVAGALTALEGCVATLRRSAPLRARTVLGVGVGVPGPVDVARGMLLHAPNLGWRNIALQRMLDERLGGLGRVFVDNDANLAVFAEYMFGAHRHSADLLYVYISDGIGGGLILGHGLYRGRVGFAGEIGHINVLPNGPRCSCGSRGCAETLFSWRALHATVRGHTGRDLEPCELRAAVDAGDRALHALVTQAGKHLGLFLGTLANVFDPKVLIVGGPITDLSRLILEPAQAEMQRRMFGAEFRSVQLERCAFSTDACAIGAAGYAFHALLQNKTDDLPRLLETTLH